MISQSWSSTPNPARFWSARSGHFAEAGKTRPKSPCRARISSRRIPVQPSAGRWRTGSRQTRCSAERITAARCPIRVNRFPHPVSVLGPVVNLSLETCIASCGQGDTQMFSSREAYENDFCPVRDELLGEMYRANENGLPQLVESVSSGVRAMLALFCYRRSHLHSLALSIAASCSERELIQRAGRVASTLYALSREAPAPRPAPSSSYGNRKPITLSTKPLSTFSSVEDEFDDEDLAQAVTA